MSDRPARFLVACLVMLVSHSNFICLQALQEILRSMYNVACKDCIALSSADNADDSIGHQAVRGSAYKCHEGFGDHG